jgi:hypothetical protein
MLREVPLAHPPDPSRRTIVNPAKVSPIRNGMGEC